MRGIETYCIEQTTPKLLTGWQLATKYEKHEENIRHELQNTDTKH